MMGAVLVTYSGAVPSNLPKRVFNNEILKPSWNEVGETFHSEMMPIRFTVAGGRLLNYAPRRGEEAGGSFKDFQRSYTGRKRRRFGHVKPLVFSGESEKLARIRDVRATSKGVRIVNHARGLNRKNPKSKIRMNEEVRRVANSEQERLVRSLDRSVGRRLSEFKKTTTVKV